MQHQKSKVPKHKIQKPNIQNMKIQNGNQFTCEECERSNVVSTTPMTLNGHNILMTKCYNCERIYEVYRDEVSLLPFVKQEETKVESKSANSKEGLIAIVVVGLFLFAVACYAFDYFSETKSANIEVSNSTIQPIENNHKVTVCILVGGVVFLTHLYFLITVRNITTEEKIQRSRKTTELWYLCHHIKEILGKHRVFNNHKIIIYRFPHIGKDILVLIKMHIDIRLQTHFIIQE